MFTFAYFCTLHLSTYSKKRKSTFACFVDNTVFSYLAFVRTELCSSFHFLLKLPSGHHLSIWTFVVVMDTKMGKVA
jgi:hypothetical protein